MSIKEAIPFPKALNIIRPSSPLINFHNQQQQQQQAQSSYSSTTQSSSTSISSISTLSNITNSQRVPPTIVTPSNFAFYNNNNNPFFNKPTQATTNAVGVNPHRFLQRPRSNSNLSKSTYFSTLSISSYGASDEDEKDDDLDSIDGLSEEEEDLIEEEEDDAIDGLSSEEEEEEEEAQPTKIVAKIKHGTIMNGKGEFVNKGHPQPTTTDESWLDEARANRKIADLEIEKASLLVLNTTLETKLRQQTLQIVELQKRLSQMNEGPLTPVSDKHVELFDHNDHQLILYKQQTEEEEIENDQVFQKIKQMLEGLIAQAEVALLSKSKQSGKVLQAGYYDEDEEETRQQNVQETLHKLTKPRSFVISPQPSQNTTTRRTRSIRRVSADTSSSTTSSTCSSTLSSLLSEKPTGTKMTRTLSRQSSPPVMMSSSHYTTTSQRPFSPPPTPTTRSASPRHYGHSQLKKTSQEFVAEKPKWK